ncbi:MAG: hypothetical protein MJB14_18235 [Spirochaetes bacterium]|nr:hypothetical protein [Spirochaetota bacterium]
MEVIQADDKLKAEILNDATKKADRILKKAQKEADGLIKEMNTQFQQYETEAQERLEQQIQQKKSTLFSTIDLDANKKNILFLEDQINQVFQEVQNKIKKQYSYQNLMITLLKKAVKSLESPPYTFEIGINESLSESDLSKVLTKKQIKFIKKGTFKEGYKIFAGNEKNFIYLSLSYFFQQIKNQYKLKILQILKEKN